MNQTIKKALLSYVPALKDYLRGRMERKIEERKAKILYDDVSHKAERAETIAVEQQEPLHPAERDAQAHREFEERNKKYYSDLKLDNPTDAEFYKYIESKEQSMRSFHISPNGYNFMSLRLLYQIKEDTAAIREHLEEALPVPPPMTNITIGASDSMPHSERVTEATKETIDRMRRSMNRALSSEFPATPEPDYHEARVRQEINELHIKDSQQ